MWYPIAWVFSWVAPYLVYVNQYLINRVQRPMFSWRDVWNAWF